MDGRMMLLAAGAMPCFQVRLGCLGWDHRVKDTDRTFVNSNMVSDLGGSGYEGSLRLSLSLSLSSWVEKGSWDGFTYGFSTFPRLCWRSFVHWSVAVPGIRFPEPQALPWPTSQVTPASYTVLLSLCSTDHEPVKDFNPSGQCRCGSRMSVRGMKG
ncbi:uncharacterized protein RSE6_06647 [Rhynchosporium secalis]|uniref:Uncharacterized protein n=1 Tax=Rhynchosporium secalis TaxID=38038 RepID=A0A1E1MAZ9_RHYSE|nr:uncharacterized protein RSE6_06647 [Rhynchosporium secalis]